MTLLVRFYFVLSFSSFYFGGRVEGGWKEGEAPLQIDIYCTRVCRKLCPAGLPLEPSRLLSVFPRTGQSREGIEREMYVS